MKIVDKLSDNKFVVEMEPSDLNRFHKVVIAHDYVMFGGHRAFCTSMHGLSGTYCHGNCVDSYQYVQVPIRMMQDIVNVALKDHKFMQPEHVTKEDGMPRYVYGTPEEYRYRNSEGVDMVAVSDGTTGEYVHMPLSVYNAIKGIKD